jgi:hypothetical protein
MGYKEPDEVLARRARRKDELRRVLERPKIPLHTNASENDLRACVIKRKISHRTMSPDGRLARDVMLGCRRPAASLRCRSSPISGRITVPSKGGFAQCLDLSQ